MIPYRLIAEVLSCLGLVALAFILRAQRDEARANFATQAQITKSLSEAVSSQTELALNHDKLHALGIENAQDKISADSAANVRNAMDLAHLAAASHARSLCPAGAGDEGDGGKSDLSPATNPAEGAARSGYQTELDDSIHCADNTVIAEGWQQWWNGISQIPNR